MAGPVPDVSPAIQPPLPVHGYDLAGEKSRSALSSRCSRGSGIPTEQRQRRRRPNATHYDIPSRSQGTESERFSRVGGSAALRRRRTPGYRKRRVSPGIVSPIEAHRYVRRAGARRGEPPGGDDTRRGSSLCPWGRRLGAEQSWRLPRLRLSPLRLSPPLATMAGSRQPVARAAAPSRSTRLRTRRRSRRVHAGVRHICRAEPTKARRRAGRSCLRPRSWVRYC